MAKKEAMGKQEGEKRCCGWTIRGLWIVCAIVLAAFGFACLIQSIALHLALGFKVGFFGYLLSFALLTAAKACKHKCCCCR